MPPDGALAVGVDGCRIGWIAAFAFGSGTQTSRTGLGLFETAADVVRWREGQAGRPVVAIDVPIGLPDRVGDRGCDREARRLLGRRQTCVFQPPDRELFDLVGGTYEDARARIADRRLAEPEARGLTQQCFNILSKIAEVDRLVRADPHREQWLIEVHPEVSFQELAGRDLPHKKSKAGKDARLRRLAREFPDLEDNLGTRAWRRRDVGIDDRLDAYVALWSALRFRRGPAHHRILGDAERDTEGVLMRMVA